VSIGEDPFALSRIIFRKDACYVLEGVERRVCHDLEAIPSHIEAHPGPQKDPS
jgi:hypothetical protein